MKLYLHDTHSFWNEYIIKFIQDSYHLHLSKLSSSYFIQNNLTIGEWLLYFTYQSESESESEFESLMLFLL